MEPNATQPGPPEFDSVEKLAEFCQGNQNLGEVVSAIRRFACPLPLHEQRAVLGDPRCLLQLAYWHDLQETEGEAMDFDCSANRIRRAQLKDMAKKIVAGDPEVWPDQVLEELGLPKSPPPPITAASIVGKMRDLLDELSGLSNPRVNRVRRPIETAVQRYESLRDGKAVTQDPLRELCAEVRALVEEYSEVKDVGLLTSALVRAVEIAESTPQ